MKTLHNILLTPHDSLTDLYYSRVGDYPKFFKMDSLSRLGFIATELLLQAEGAPRFVERDDRAVVFVSRHASLHNDQAYLKTIQPDNYFPSPSLFVYTLPNVVAGEVAIRNRYLGETACYVASEDDVESLIASAFNTRTTSVIGGWLDVTDEKNFIANISIWTH